MTLDVLTENYLVIPHQNVEPPEIFEWSENKKPDIIVIHVGSHDIDFRQLRYNAVENIGKDIINITQRCRQSGFSKVIISSILVKKV